MHHQRVAWSVSVTVALALVTSSCVIQPTPVTVTIAPEATVTVTATPAPVRTPDPEAQAAERRVVQWQALAFRWSNASADLKAQICEAVASDVASVVEAQRTDMPELDQAIGEEFFTDACS